MIICKDISFSYNNDRPSLKNLSYSINEGEWIGIIGPNGSGKSTFLNVLCGLISPSEGIVTLDGELITKMSNREIARKIAVLSQHNSYTYSYNVKETVKLGRLSYTSTLFPKWSEQDEQSVENALNLTNSFELQNSLINELSGGERQRIFLAQCFAQETPYIFLDEPSNHLDIRHTMNILDMLKKLQTKQRKTVVTVFHDLNLASIYCDRILSLKNGEIIFNGPTEEMLTEENLENLFDTSFQILLNPETNKKVIVNKSNVF